MYSLFYFQLFLIIGILSSIWYIWHTEPDFPGDIILLIIKVCTFLCILPIISKICDKFIYNPKIKEIKFNGQIIKLKDIFSGTFLLNSLNKYRTSLLTDKAEASQIKNNLHIVYNKIIEPYLQMIKQNHLLAKNDSMPIDKALNFGIKKDVIPIICSCFNDMQWQQYIPDYFNNSIQDIPEDILKSLILPYFNRAKLDDFIKGTFKGLKYEIIEGKFYRESNEKTISNIFKGIILVIETNKHTNSHTIITPSAILKKQYHSLQKIYLEDIIFEKKYSVFSDDEVEARYMITTSFMERFNNLKTAFAINDVRCAFYKNKIIFAFNSIMKDFFEPVSTITNDILTLQPLHNRLDNADKNFYKLFDELVATLEIIDYFKLNMKLGF